MEYVLKNGKTVTIRGIRLEDAEEMISLISTVDTETLFLARNPGEFNTGVERERNIIDGVLKNPNSTWFVAECDGRVIGQCHAGLVSGYERFRHRAELSFIILKEFCDMGIGGKMMEECLKWCIDHQVSQAELDVVTNNKRAIKMYQSFGFEIVGTVPKALKYLDGSFADEYRMIKFL